MHRLNKQASNARPTATPQIMKLIDSNFERVKPRFDRVSVDVVDSTVQSQSKEAGPITEWIGEKRRLGEFAFLTELMDKCNCWIRSVVAE
jgi:hypothetical protein